MSVIDLLVSEVVTGNPDAIDFVAQLSGGDVNVVSVQVDQDHIHITLDRSVNAGETGTISYIVGENKIIDADGNYIHSFTKTIINNIVQLIVANGSHAHTVDGEIVIIQAYILAVEDGSHSHAADGNFTILQNHYLSVQDSSHTHTADGDLILTQESAFDPATLILCAEGRYSTPPPDALKALINKTIVDLKTAGLWIKIKKLYCRQVHELPFALQNWKANDSNGVAYNNVAFTPGVGVQGDAISAYINNNFKPNLTFTEAAHGYAIWLKQPSTNGGNILGSMSASGARNYINEILSPTRLRPAFGGNGEFIISGIANDQFRSFDRTDATNRHHWLNGGNKTNATATTGTSLSTVNMYTLAVCLSDQSASSPSNCQLAWEVYKDLLTDNEELALYNILAYFNANVGGTL